MELTEKERAQVNYMELTEKERAQVNYMELTEKERAQVIKIRQKWDEKFRSLKYDEDKMREFARYVYELSGHSQPEKIVICDSPKECQEKANEEAGTNKTYVFNHYGNASDITWCAPYDYFRKLGMVEEKVFDLLFESGVFLALYFDTHAFLSKPPVFMNMDENKNLHCTTDYAIYFRDGYGKYFIYGRRVPDEIMEKFLNDELTAEDIMGLNNAELKMALIKEWQIA